MFGEPDLGRITSITSPRKGRKYIRIRSEDDSSETNKLDVPNEMLTGFKKGDWVYYETEHYGLGLKSIEHVPTPPGLGAAACCGTCVHVGNRYTTFAPFRCKKFRTVIALVHICREYSPEMVVKDFVLL
jgi:hypothetical protein